ncbi:MAG: metallophosphoesterase [Rhizorhabdus sp.]
MRLTLTAIASGWFLLIYMLLLAGSEPVVRYFSYSPGPESKIARKQRIILLTDIHVSGPDMSPERLAQIVETINELRPDIVMLGGDFVSATKLSTRRYDIARALHPIASLRA